MTLKELHTQAAEAGEGMVNLTIGDLTALAESVKDRIPKAPATPEETESESVGDAKTRDVFLSCLMAGEIHSENIRCLKYAPDILCLTTLIEGPAIISQPTTKRRKPIEVVVEPIPEIQPASPDTPTL